MRARGLLTTLALGVMCAGATLARAHPTPAPEVVHELRRHHGRGGWWRITTDSARYEARVRDIGAEGLGGFTTRRPSRVMPERIGWSSIARIDERESHELRGQITWMLLGLGAGIIPLANGHANSSQPRNYMLGGAIAGAAWGRHLGSRNIHERPLYVAPSPPSPPAPVVVLRDTVVSDTLPVPTSTAAAAEATQPGQATPEILRACRRLSSRDLLRISGDLGTFHGYASSIGPAGLGGLRLEPTLPSVQSPGSLDWERISRVECRGSNAGAGALRGALTVGAFTGLMGFLIINALGPNGSDASVPEVVVASAGVGVGIGGLLGAAIGATVSSWHRVYERP